MSARAEKAIEEIKAEQQNKSGELSKNCSPAGGSEKQPSQSRRLRTENGRRTGAVTSLETQIASFESSFIRCNWVKCEDAQLQTELVKKDTKYSNVNGSNVRKNKLASLEQSVSRSQRSETETQQLETELAKKDENIMNLNAQLTEREASWPLWSKYQQE